MTSRSLETRAQPTLQRGDLIPDFTLPDRSGEPISRRSFYMRRNLVIAFLPDSIDEQWIAWTEGLASAMREIPYDDVQAILIVGGSTDAERISGATDESIIVLIDDNRQAAKHFGFDGQGGLLVITDVFGEVFYSASGDPDDKEVDPAEIPEWVELVVCQC